MPKVVDHDAYRADLAQRAAQYFSDHGYAGTGMRQIAQHLGISKSALYHYFPTKEALFLATTQQVMSSFAVDLIDPSLSQTQNIQRLEDALRVNFAADMLLTFDYLRGKSRDDIAQDQAMQLAMSTARDVAAQIAGPAQADAILAQVFGRLLVDYMSGR